MSLIGEAFVRIRADSAGFKTQVESDTRHAFSGVGKIVAGAFAVGGAVDFTKQIVGHAADVQKQVEAIRAEFGGASDAVLRFGEHGAAALGVSAHLADQTAARFGVLAKNLGLSPRVAAEVTVNFEKLAGSISQIRNVDPEKLFQNLPLALAGNTRSMRALGIVTNDAQLKIAAFKLGLTQTVDQALTPSQKALALYAVATSNLGAFQRQAKSHADDLANVQRRLTAEWDNGRDALGRGLLPLFARFGAFLSANLPGAIERVRTDFHQFANILTAVTKPLGGLKAALEGFIAALAIGKIIAFAGAIRTDLIANGARLLAREFQVSEGEVVGAFTGMELAAVGFAATLRAALISTGFGALAVAAGFAAEYIITHWSKVKGWFNTFWSDLKQTADAVWISIVQGAKLALYTLLQEMTFVVRETLRLGSHLPFVGGQFKDALNSIQHVIDQFKPDESKISRAFGNIGTRAAQAMSSAALKALGQDRQRQTESLDPQTYDSAQATATARAVAALKTSYGNIIQTAAAGEQSLRNKIATLNQNLADAVTQQAADLKNAVESAKQNLMSLGQSLSQSIDQYLDQPLLKLQTKLAALQNRQSLENLRRSIILPGGHQLSTDPNKALAQLRELTGGGGTNQGALGAFVTQYQQAVLQVRQDQVTALKQRSDRSIADLTDAFNRGSITLAQFRAGIAKTLAADHVSYRKAGELLGTAFANGFRATAKGLLQQAGIISTSPHVAGVTGSDVQIIRPLDQIHSDSLNIAHIQAQIRSEHGQLQSRIAKAAEKTAAVVQQIHSVQLGATSKTLKKDLTGTIAALTGTK